jgi:hypothetical protein
LERGEWIRNGWWKGKARKDKSVDCMGVGRGICIRVYILYNDEGILWLRGDGASGGVETLAALFSLSHNSPY